MQTIQIEGKKYLLTDRVVKFKNEHLDPVNYPDKKTGEQKTFYKQECWLADTDGDFRDVNTNIFPEKNGHYEPYQIGMYHIAVCFYPDTKFRGIDTKIKFVKKDKK